MNEHISIVKNETSEGENSPRKRLDRKKTLIGFGLSVAFSLAIFLTYYWFIYSGTHISTDDAYLETDVSPIHARVMGYVKEVLHSEGDTVAAGETLALLDDTDFKVELAFKEEKFKKSENDVKRARSLYESSAISHSDLETAEAGFVANRADREGTLLKIKYAHITSPVAGKIGKRSAQPGQFVQPGQSLFVVIPSDKIWVKANFKETQLQKVRPGMKVMVQVDAYPGEEFEGHLTSIFPASGSVMSLLPPENATGNFTKTVQRIPVKIDFDPGSNKELRPGMSVQATIVTQ